MLSAATAAERQPVVAAGVDLDALPDGSYTVAVAPPAEDAAAWDLASVTCDGAAAPISGLTATVTLTPGAPRDCVFRIVRTPGGLRLRLVTLDGSAIGMFSVAGETPRLRPHRRLRSRREHGRAGDARGRGGRPAGCVAAGRV